MKWTFTFLMSSYCSVSCRIMRVYCRFKSQAESWHALPLSVCHRCQATGQIPSVQAILEPMLKGPKCFMALRQVGPLQK